MIVWLWLLIPISLILFGYKKQESDSVMFVGIVSFCASLMVLITFTMGVKNAEVRRDIINKEYNTNYTVEEIYRAEDIILLIEVENGNN